MVKIFGLMSAVCGDQVPTYENHDHVCNELSLLNRSVDKCLNT